MTIPKNSFDKKCMSNDNTAFGRDNYNKDDKVKYKDELFIDEISVKLRIAEELAGIGYWELDIEKNSFSFSDEFYRIMNLSKENPIADFGLFLQKYVHPEYLNVVKSYFEELISKGSAEQVEFEIVLDSGLNKILKANAHIAPDQNGGTKVIGAFQDVTQSRTTEDRLREQFNFINALIETVPNPIFYKDNNLVYKHVNTSFCEYIGLSKDKIIDHTVYDISEHDLASIYEKADLALMQNKGKQNYQARVRYNDGTFHDVIFNKATVLNENGDVKGLVGIINDITERIELMKKLERLMKLKDSILEISNSIMEKNNLKELYELTLEKVLSVMDNADVGCILTLDENNIFSISASTGYSEEEAKSYRFKLEDSFQWKETNGNIGKTIIINDIEEYFKDEVIPTLLDNDKGLPIRSSVSAPIIIDGRLFGLINIDSHKNNVFDDDDREMMDYLRVQLVSAISRFKLYENIIYLSEHDKLTGVYNRRHFENLFHIIKDKSLRYNNKFFIALFDLNGLKKINDTYGHLAGDELIIQFTQRLKSGIRASDILARYGGDEFVAIFFEAERADIIERLNSLRDFFEDNPIAFEENSITCSFSYGLAQFPLEGTSYDELIGIADHNMYIYKNRTKFNH